MNLHRFPSLIAALTLALSLLPAAFAQTLSAAQSEAKADQILDRFCASPANWMR